MRISELRAREDYDGVLAQTLGPALGAWLGAPVTLTPAEQAPAGAQRWALHQLYSAYLTADAGPEVRRFLRDGFRVTHSPLRAAPQWALGTLAGTVVGARLASAPAFALQPGLPRAARLALLPGNRRFRLFDFEAGVSRVMAKASTGDSALAAEVALRSGPGPWLPLVAQDPALRWFEEPIHDGVPLSRAPLWAPRAALAEEALATLDRVSQRGAEAVATADHVEALMRRAGLPAALRPRGLAPELSLGLSHGDAQPGNVLVRRGTPPLWVDWEFAGRRVCGYDRAVFALRLRFPEGLARRVRAVMEGLSVPLASLPALRGARRTLLAVVLLEELATVADARRSLGLSGDAPAVPELVAALKEVLSP